MAETPKDWGYPSLSFNQCMDICRRIKEMGGNVQVDRLAAALGVKVGGWFALQMAALRRWSLVEGRGEIKLSAIYRRIIAPQYPGDDQKAKLEAFKGIPLFAEIYEKYKDDGLPEDQYLVNVLRDSYHLRGPRDPSLVAGIIREFLAENVPQYGTPNAPTDIPSAPKVPESGALPPQGIIAHSNEGFMVEMNISGQVPFKWKINTEQDWGVIQMVLNAAKENWQAQKKSSEKPGEKKVGHD